MKNFNLKFVFICAAISILCISSSLIADWNPSEPHKMHYPQLPDPCGWDVCANCQFLADDFQCSQTSPITDIHFWISWLSDEIGQISNAYIGIHSDNLGTPGAALWTWHGQGKMTIRRYGKGPQGWVCPSSNWIVPNNHIYFDQVNITDINDPITQERSRIYWLVIRLNPQSPSTVPGWKTSRNAPPGVLFGKPAMWSLDMLNWKPVNTGTTALVNHDMAFVITGQPPQPKLEFGDAPEGSLAYPIECVQGAFPTCINTGPAGWIQHTNFGAYFGPLVDFENEGNAGNCPLFTPNNYDRDECFQDGDGGLLYPPAFTIVGPVGSETVVPCGPGPVGSLGIVCNMAVWGQNLDIEVHNHMPSDTNGYVNVLVDWNKDGRWAGSLSGCAPGAAPEHVLVNFPVPNPYDGPLSNLLPPNFLIGPYPGYVWTRFTITEKPIPIPSSGWDGSGAFEDGESEDYLIHNAPVDKLMDCDWNTGDDHKMHWPQLPDLDPTGLDVDMFWTPLGDDFNCVETGLITDIHFWASFPDDCLPPQGVAGLTFQISIYSNIPANTQIPWSRPGEILWGRVFEPCTYTVEQVANDRIEGWYDPATQLYIPADHNQCYQYNFCMKPEEGLFLQKEGTTYWLVIKDLPPPTPNYTIGWKTTSPWLRWNDDAVWLTATGGWMPLTYPKGHPYEGLSFDLAFVITGQPPPPTLDFGDAPQTPYPTKLDADGARHTVGAILMGVTVDAESDGQPNVSATGDDLNGFVDDEDGVTFTSGLVPGQWATVDVDLTNCAPVFTVYLNAWIDFNGDGSWAELGDQIFDDVFVTPGIVNSLIFWVPFWAGPNITTYSRFRLSTVPGLSYTGYASDGEVEDHTVDISENLKIKWIQPPDREPNGIDIKIDQMRRVADDFKCTTTGYITDIHFWGSWKYDEVGQINSIKVKIYSDDPVGAGGTDPCNTYSMPDELYWEHEFLPEQFSMRPEPGEAADGEYWWDPVTGQLIPSGDKQIWRVDMELPWCQSFMQEGSTSMPVIYWLCIEVNTASGEFGWKTRKWPDHFMDDACFSAGSELPYFWKELRYPERHPYHNSKQNSIDMAFVLTGIEPKPPTPHLKWSQPPLEIDLTNNWPFYCGWNEPSWTQNPDRPLIGIAAADDFRCLGKMPITSVHWWGSYQGWLDTQLPAPQPMAWLISFWTNAPVMPPGFSHPGQLLQRIWIPADRVKTEWVGIDHFPMNMPEACFQYNVDLYQTEYFWQDKFSSQTIDNIYWISIKAIYPGDVVVPNPWGWKTRPVHWMDDAVRMECTDSSPPGQLVCNYMPLENPMTSESMDLAFELDTDPNWIKWEQPFTGLRNWKHYEDQLSMADIDTAGNITYRQVVADDWLCTKRTPVTAIVWWGSYLGYRYQPCVTGQQPVQPVKPDAFLISIWTDVPAHLGGTNPFSHPGRKIWEYMAYNYDEVLVGCDKYPEGSSGAREPVYRYSVRLPGERWFRQRKINQIYWISIVAIYQAANDPTYKWGWTNHRHVFQDDAVAGIVLAGGTGWDWQELYDQTGKSADQSFVLFTDPGVCVSCPDYDWNDIVNFKDYADFADQWKWIGLPGGFSDSDLNCDGVVDCEDLKIVCDLWLVSCPLP